MSPQQAPLSLHRLTFISMLNQDLVANYLAHLWTRHYSAQTLQTTLGALVTFYRLLPPARQPRLWHDIPCLTPADVDAWLQTAQRKGLAPSTLHSLLSVVRRFCTLLQEQGLLAHHPIHPRHHEVLVPQMLPRPMVEDDLIRFFQVIDGLRDRTMFLLMLRCGLRVSEVAGIKRRCIDWAQHSGRKDRVVYLSADAVAALTACLALRPEAVPNDLFFWNRKRTNRPLSTKGIQRKVERYAKAAGIHASCHNLRHTFASNLLEEGAEVVAIKELMGRASIKSSERSAQLSNQRVKHVYWQTMKRVMQKTRV